MPGDAVAGDGLHLLGANLNFDGHPVHAEERGMQRLVTIGLRNGDVILEAPRQGLVKPVHGAEDPIAGVRPIDDDPKPEDIHDVSERLLLLSHLSVNGKEVLLPAKHPRLNALAREALL